MAENKKTPKKVVISEQVKSPQPTTYSGSYAAVSKEAAKLYYPASVSVKKRIVSA